MVILYILGGIIAAALAIALVYFVLIAIGSLIPVNKKYKPAKDGIRTYISTNGIHTDFILPMKSEEFDWTSILDSTPYAKPLDQYRYLAIGCGDRGFYLELETWAELSWSIAAKAMLVPTQMIMHAIGYDTLPKDQKVREITLTCDQYKGLCQFIYKSFALDSQHEVQLIPDVGYTENDNFYQAVGVYHAFHTCNYWVNKGLKRIGVRTSFWSPVAKGMFYQIEKITGKVRPSELSHDEQSQLETSSM